MSNSAQLKTHSICCNRSAPPITQWDIGPSWRADRSGGNHPLRERWWRRRVDDEGTDDDVSNENPARPAFVRESLTPPRHRSYSLPSHLHLFRPARISPTDIISGLVLALQSLPKI